MANSNRFPLRCSKYGIGKRMWTRIYLHRSCESVLPGHLLRNAKEYLPTDVEYNVVKFDEATGAFSFIVSPDFDEVPEPHIGEFVTVSRDGNLTIGKSCSDPKIYQHKWLFVTDDYAGFDVESAKQRSAKILSLAGVDRSKIGSRGYWNEHVLPKLDETERQDRKGSSETSEHGLHVKT